MVLAQRSGRREGGDGEIRNLKFRTYCRAVSWRRRFRRNMAHYNCFGPRKSWFFAILIVSVSFSIILAYMNHSSARLAREASLEELIAVMQTRLKFLETRYGGKQEEIYDMQARIQRGPLSANDVQNTTYSPELEAFLRNISGSRVSDALLSSEKSDLIKAPFSLRIMPHLLENPDSLRPAYHLKSPRNFVDYIIGIPHVKRDKETYLYDTIRHLLKTMTPEDKNSTLIVVMVGETDLHYVIQTAYKLEDSFPRELDAGQIEVISPNKHYYPDLKALPQTLGDSQKRTRWRTKQNLDAIFLMAYSYSRCLYYLMIEDDVVALDGYMTEIRRFTASTSVSNPNWFFIQYSTTGGIGKLFRSTDLIHFITYVQLFYNNMPIDWLTESYLMDRTCSINKTSKDCVEARNKIRPTYRKNLFKHIGLFSSLKGKILKVKNNGETNIAEYFPHDNPPVSTIRTDLDYHGKYTIEKAYNGESFYWGLPPHRGDVIEFWFQEPIYIGRYVIRSGNLEHSNDKIYNAVLEVLPNKVIQNFTQINEFDEFGMVEGSINGDEYGDLQAIRIRFTEPSTYWVVITEIEFVPVDKETET